MEPPASLPDPNDMEFLDDPSSAPSILWDWGDLLDFSVDVDDDRFPPLTSSSSLDPTLTTESLELIQVSDRVRKRDPRMICSNYLAGRVPCACPELDEELEEKEEGIPGKKRVRVARRAGGARCQVPECEADISELKGYHRRHRVCLNCANAGAVVLDGETKRYCQQCGKFHVLSDFDEGKRSCRRKLEKHNNRRRRKPPDSRVAVDSVAVDKETGRDLHADEVACDVEPGKEDPHISCQTMVEEEVSVEPEDGNTAALQSDPSSQNVNSDSGVSFAASGDHQMDGKKEDSKHQLSTSYCDNKSAYSSVCPTGRISFKLYDWNPAEFPRRLRHQIFQWLASMPVELEGYIRPGCTILTSFIAMPKFMWVKLLEDPVLYVHDLVIVPGQMLSGRGPILVYLNNLIFQVMKDGYSLMKVNVKEQAPKLHYVHPMCFEAGGPMEFVACGSNLLQRKFRFLVSFAGKYLTYDSCVALPCHDIEGFSSLHQLYQIFIPCIEPDLSGPAFIEVENESGLSNFIPVLIGNREICCEMKTIQQKFDASLPNGSNCEVFASSQVAFSEFVVDIAWLLKEPSLRTLQQYMTSTQIQRFTSLLSFLLHHDSTAILDRVLEYLKPMMDEIIETSANDGTSDVEMQQMLLSHVKYASNVLSKKLQRNEALVVQSTCRMQENDCIPGNCCESSLPSVAPSTNQGLAETSDRRLDVCATPNVVSDKVPLLSGELVTKMNLLSKESPSKSFNQVVSNRVLKSRPSILVIAAVAICFGVCAAILHPQKVSQFAVSIRRCLTDRL